MINERVQGCIADTLTIVKCDESSAVRNCQMKGMSAVSNSDCRNGMRWQNPEIRNMSITTSAYWADA